MAPAAAGADAAVAASDLLAPLAPWLGGLFRTVSIGSWQFAPARLLAALLLFLAVVVLVRALRRWLAATLLDPRRMEASAAHSLDKALGYAGFVVALLSALSVAGLDITNIAIVAGALSVGIGLGLQSIVNNFVSGLILLAERPVKVGDWVEIKGASGRITRISVRATEIETASGAATFVPNADLIANAVTNLTPRSSLGQAVVRVGVGHGADPERVMAALAEAAAGSAGLLAEPPPTVTFDDIADSALRFSVRGSVAGVKEVGAAETALRSRVVAALRNAGIEIARPQSDVHLRDLDGVRGLLARAIEERERERAERARNV